MDPLTSKIYREGWLAHERGAKYESNPYSKAQLLAFCAWCAGWNDYSNHNYKIELAKAQELEEQSNG